MTVLDAQVHIWGAETPQRPWPPSVAALAHRPTPLGKDELLRDMNAAGVDRAILVPPSWEGDHNDLALEAALWPPDRFNVAVKATSLPSYVTEAYPYPSLHVHIRRVVGGMDRIGSSGGLIGPGCVARIVRPLPSSLRHSISSPTSIQPGLWITALPNGSAGRCRQYNIPPK